MKYFTVSLIALTLLAGPLAYADTNVDASADVSAETRGADVKSNLQLRLEANKEHRDEMKANLEAKREDFKTQTEERRQNFLEHRTEVKARFETKVRDRVKTFIGNIIKHFDNVIVRLDNVSGKISDRIQVFKDRGVDVSESEDLLVKADAQLEIAKDDVAKAKVALDAEVLKDEVSRDQIHALIETAKESLRAAHKAYVDVIVSLKASVKVDASTETEVE